MQALMDLHNELVAIYGYEVEICAALQSWSGHLKSMQNTSKTNRIIFGRGDPNNTHAKFQYAKSIAYLINASRKNGINSNTHRRSVVTLVHAIWEEKYRKRIAAECGLDNKNGIQSDVFHDLNKYRQAILHVGGKLDKKPKVIHFFRVGDEVLLTDDHMYELFEIIINELNRVGKIYYGQDPQLSLDKPLNDPS